MIPNTQFQRAAWWTIGVLAALAIYVFLLVNRIPDVLRPVSIAVRYSFTLVMPALFVIFLLGFLLPGRWGLLTAFTLTTAVFAFSLAGLWASGQTEPYAVSGLLPWNDAATYYSDAGKMLEGEPLSAASARRPLFMGLLGALLGLAGRDLQIALAVLVLFTAVSCFLAMRELQYSHGAPAAVIMMLIVLMYSRRFSGTTMTENLGLALGLLGLALLWRGTADCSRKLVLLGILTVTLALNARAGTFFLLPALVLWGGWAFRGKTKYSWLFALQACAAIVLGFAINFLVFKLIGTQEGLLFDNFSYSLYGLASGGENWALVMHEHPEIMSLPEADRSRQVYALAFEIIRADPMGLITGAFKQWGLLFSETWFSAYAYVGGENESLARIVRTGLFILSGVSLIDALRDLKKPHNTLVWAMALGVFLSVPFVPPGDAHKMRAYAASIPIFALLPGLGAAALLKFYRGKPFLKHTPQPLDNRATALFTIALVLFTVIAPVVSKAVGRPAEFRQVSCPAGQESVYIRKSPGSYLQIIREDVLALDWVPTLHLGRFRMWVHNLPNDEAIEEFARIEAPSTIIYNYDEGSRLPTWLVANSDLIPAQDGILGACGNYSDNPNQRVQDYRFFYATSIELASP
ncbi:MAG: hypothetical protein AB9891_07730 [Anaerolineaceae bacterium]